MQLKVNTGIKIEIYNSCYAKGHYYPDDDWSIEAIAPTYEKAIELIIPKYIKSHIYPANIYVSIVKYVVYNGKKHVIYDSEEKPEICKNADIISDIKRYPLFEKIYKEEEEKRLKIAKEKKAKIEREKEKYERKLLEKLKKKYGE